MITSATTYSWICCVLVLEMYKGLERLNASHLKSLEELSYFPGLVCLRWKTVGKFRHIRISLCVKDPENLKLYDMDRGE